MPTFRYAKLVRDNIRIWHEQNGHTVAGEQLKGDALLAAMITKLHEEADEVDGALNREELIEEIGDVQQIIDDILTAQNIPKHELDSVKKAKAEKKGGFLAGEYIETVTIPDEDDLWAQYCRKSPEKYPEVNSDQDIQTHKEWIETVQRVSVVVVCVIKQDDKFLMVQEAQISDYGLWCLPAGHVDVGEDLESAAVREVKEETNLDIALGEEIALYHETAEKTIKHVYVGKVLGGEVKPQDGEILQVAWMSLDDIKELHARGELRRDWVMDAVQKGASL